MSIDRTKVLRLLGAWLAVTVLILSAACSKGGSGSTQIRRSARKSELPQKPTRLDRDPSKNPQVPSPGQASGPGTQAGSDSGATSSGDSIAPVPVAIDSGTQSRENVRGGIADVKDAFGRDLYYSGASQDDLREKLLSHLAAEPDKDQKIRDAKLASAISFGSFTVNWETRRARASFVVQRENGKLPIAFEGQLSKDLVLRGGGLSRTGEFQIEAYCMDLHGGCNTALIKIHERVGKTVRNAYVLQRQTRAAIRLDAMDFKVSQNNWYDRLHEIIWNADHRPDAPATVKYTTLTTTEVMNGSADFTIEMSLAISRLVDEVIAWSGPLVRPDSCDDECKSSGKPMNLPIALQPTRAREDGRIRAFPNYISDTISDTRLVDNDGRGDLTLDLTIGKDNERAIERTMSLHVMRMQTPVKDLQLER